MQEDASANVDSRATPDGPNHRRAYSGDNFTFRNGGSEDRQNARSTIIQTIRRSSSHSTFHFPYEGTQRDGPSHCACVAIFYVLASDVLEGDLSELVCDEFPCCAGEE